MLKEKHVTKGQNILSTFRVNRRFDCINYYFIIDIRSFQTSLQKLSFAKFWDHFQTNK